MILYRGESNNFSKHRKAYAGIFFYGDIKERQSYNDFGKLVKYQVKDNAKIFHGVSSEEFCKSNNLWNKEYKELIPICISVIKATYGEDTDIPKEDYEHFTSLNKIDEWFSYLLDRYNDSELSHIFTASTQLVARIELEKKGYMGAFWDYEDPTVHKQYQLWDNSIYKKIKKEKELSR